MKKEYNFTNGVRGKFFAKNAKFNLPIYLDEDVSDFITTYAKKKKIDQKILVNLLLRNSKDLLNIVASNK